MVEGRSEGRKDHEQTRKRSVHNQNSKMQSLYTLGLYMHCILFAMLYMNFILHNKISHKLHQLKLFTSNLQPWSLLPIHLLPLTSISNIVKLMQSFSLEFTSTELWCQCDFDDSKYFEYSSGR